MSNNLVRKFKLIFIDFIVFVSVYVATAVIAKYSYTGVTIHPIHSTLSAAIFWGCILLVRFLFGVYSNVWRYANSKAYLQMVIADIIAGLLAVFVTHYLYDIYIGIWQSATIFALFNVTTLSSRFMYQQRYRRLHVNLNENNKIGVAIVGAGQIGSLLAEELMYSASSHYRPVCFIDTNQEKIGSRLSGLKVYPETPETIELLKTLPIQEIFIALPSIDGETASKLHEFYSASGCKVKLYDFPLKETNDTIDEDIEKRVIREIKIEDLLFRDALKVNDYESKEFYQGRIILVTGGGGSIGSEICRQIAKQEPKQLIIFDIYENNAYEIQQELLRKYGNSLNLEVEIGSVRDVERLDAIFANYKPEVVFHAAAHKHVPLMEHSNCEAIKNNVMGTYNTANMAEKYGVKKFILISTDKAVNPTNIMGATKRMCEMVIQCRYDSKTSFAAVRFGNVLGSNGSVIPLFKKQIEKGGPITITDKRIIRYFMTIPEASQLVLQAGAMAKSGELFVLDMGKPVKILDLAENMIRLSGLQPYVNVDIVEIGLRPGEKLYEELLIKTENLNKTDNNMIFIEQDKPLSREEVEEKLDVLCNAVKMAEHEIASDLIREAMKVAVPTYCDPEEINCRAEISDEMQMI